MTVNVSTAHQFAVVRLNHDNLRVRLYEDGNDGHPWKALGWLSGQRLDEEFDSCTELLKFMATIVRDVENVSPSVLLAARDHALNLLDRVMR